MAAFWKRFLGGSKDVSADFCTAVLVAAGSSSRMNGLDKLFCELQGEPVLAYTLRALNDCPLIDEIVVVTRAESLVPVSNLCKSSGADKVTRVVVGGDTRTQSALSGIREANEEATLIAIHDGARPFVSQQVLEAVIRSAAETGAAAPAVAVKDTIKRVENGLVTQTLPREELRAVQTPQVFEASLIRAALQKALDDKADVTDDCAAVERIGMKVTLTQGAAENFKITTPTDLLLANGLLEGDEIL